MWTTLSVIGLGALSKYTRVFLCDRMGTRRRERMAEKQGERSAGYTERPK